jgi:hypothetical protein
VRQQLSSAMESENFLPLLPCTTVHCCIISALAGRIPPLQRVNSTCRASKQLATERFLSIRAAPGGQQYSIPHTHTQWRVSLGNKAHRPLNRTLLHEEKVLRFEGTIPVRGVFLCLPPPHNSTALLSGLAKIYYRKRGECSSPIEIAEQREAIT